MAKPPNFIGTTVHHGAPYISNLPSVPPVILSAPTTSIENSVRGLTKLPAPLQPTKTAAIHASKTAIDRLRELVAKFRS